MEDHLFPVEAVKRCCTCKQVKPLDEFNKLARSRDGHQPSCRACNRKYHYDNWDRHMSQIRRRKRHLRIENRRRLFELLSASSCADCGISDPLVLEFDHLRDKRNSIANLISGGFEWAYIEDEIARCEIVCANCHRRRTVRRANSFRYRLLDLEGEDAT